MENIKDTFLSILEIVLKELELYHTKYDTYNKY